MHENPIARLLSSSKALVVLTVIALAFVAIFTGTATWEEAASLIRWTLGPWLLAQGAEDAAKHFAQRPLAPPVQVTTTTTTPPPPLPPEEKAR